MTTHLSPAPGLPVPRDDGAAAHVRGAWMPELSLRSTDHTTVDLADLPGPRTIVFLYPLTAHPGVELPQGWEAIPGARGCTPEACGFRDDHESLLRAGAAAVFGLSSQGLRYQREAVARLHLPFPMLSDPHLELAAALALPTFEVDGMRLFKRLTLVVTGGVAEHVFYPVFPPDQHAHEVLTWLLSH
ncbi:peroxiredoxin [Cellulomonas sp. KRMCY2]|uniref:peroxiredoxin n=1 Tax=Cellulomonas sp. KRMCY2 TaxID=1304865 RepID=UPI00045EC197|nr:peroxiredoxin [Cellulomonas sp. KRMCY2]